MTAIITVDVDPAQQVMSEMSDMDELTDMDGGGYACAYSEDGDPAVTNYDGTKVYETSRGKGQGTKEEGKGQGTNGKGQRMEQADEGAPNFHTVFRKKPSNDRAYGRAVPVKFFTTRYTPGSWIRNAITGDMEPVRVGSIEEHHYFKVGLSTGELGTDAYGKHLYYESPDQYERHFGFRLSPEVVETWYDNVARAQEQSQARAQERAQEQVQNTIVK